MLAINDVRFILLSRDKMTYKDTVFDIFLHIKSLSSQLDLFIIAARHYICGIIALSLSLGFPSS